MTKTLRRYFNALRSDEKHIKNVENYLYGTMQNLFGVWWNRQAAREYAAEHPEEQNLYSERTWGLKRYISSFKQLQVLHTYFTKATLKSLRSKNRYLEWSN